MDTFGTVVTCMDGRIQSCVRRYIKKKTNVDFVDVITLAGPAKVISENSKHALIKNVKFRLDTSRKVHFSNFIGVVGHHDCAGVKFDDEKHKKHIIDSALKVKEWHPDTAVEALWVNDDFEVEVLSIL